MRRGLALLALVALTACPSARTNRTGTGPEPPAVAGVPIDAEVAARVWRGLRGTRWYGSDSGARQRMTGVPVAGGVDVTLVGVRPDGPPAIQLQRWRAAPGGETLSVLVTEADAPDRAARAVVTEDALVVLTAPRGRDHERSTFAFEGDAVVITHRAWIEGAPGRGLVRRFEPGRPPLVGGLAHHAVEQVNLAAARLGFVSEVRFAQDAVSLTPEAEVELDRAALFLHLYPEARILAEGHDDVRSPDEIAQRVSEARAEAVANHLRSRGVSGTRVRTRAYGADRPICQLTGAPCHALNRRVVLTIVAMDE